jgi:hypothetical protein
MLERKRLEEEQAAMFAAKQRLADPVVVEAFRETSPQTRPPSRNVTPGGSGESAWLKQALQGIGDRNLPVLQRNVGRGSAAVNSLLSNIPTRQSDEFGQSNLPFFTGTGIGGAVANRSLKTPPGASAAPIIPTGARARHHPGFDQYAYAGKPNRTNPFSSKLLGDLRKPEDEDEFMSWDNKMFLLSLLEGMQGGKPPTPYGTAVGGGNKSWTTLPSMRMS